MYPALRPRKIRPVDKALKLYCVANIYGTAVLMDVSYGTSDRAVNVLKAVSDAKGQAGIDGEKQYKRLFDEHMNWPEYMTSECCQKAGLLRDVVCISFFFELAQMASYNFVVEYNLLIRLAHRQRRDRHDHKQNGTEPLRPSPAFYFNKVPSKRQPMFQYQLQVIYLHPSTKHCTHAILGPRNGPTTISVITNSLSCTLNTSAISPPATLIAGPVNKPAKKRQITSVA